MQEGHRNHAHTHIPSISTDERRIGITFVLIFVFMIIEIAGGLVAHSLALIADGGHMVSDAAALGMSWLAIRVGKRPADLSRSYGYKRLEVLAAFANGCTLFLIAGWIVFEAVRRFASPEPVIGSTMMAVAIAGLIANLIAFWILNTANRTNLNIRGAWLHVLGDLLGFVVAIIAAAVILWTGWSPIDPLLSILVAVLILRSAYQIVRSSSHILLEGTPPHVDTEAMSADLNSLLPVGAAVHHLHVWSLTAETPLVTLHVSCLRQEQPTPMLSAIKSRLRERYGIGHSTIQIEQAGCADDDR